MYIPIILLVAIIVLYIYNQDRLKDEISGLRQDISDLKDDRDAFDVYDLDYFDDGDRLSDTVKASTIIKDDKEYTLEESHDRATLGVSYNAPLQKIRVAYSNILNKQGIDVDNNITEIHSAYKRLKAKELKRL